MDFTSLEEFEEELCKIIETACALLRKNKGIQVFLSEHSAGQRKLLFNEEIFELYFYLKGPKGSHKMAMASNGMLPTGSPNNPYDLPMIMNDLKLKRELMILQTKVPEREYITVCMACWFYYFGKAYNYF